MKEEQERVRLLLSDTVALLCKNGLSFNSDLKVQGVLGITVDSDNVFIVHINEKYEQTRPTVMNADTTQISDPSSTVTAEEPQYTHPPPHHPTPSPQRKRRAKHREERKPSTEDIKPVVVTVKEEPECDDDLVMITDDINYQHGSSFTGNTNQAQSGTYHSQSSSSFPPLTFSEVKESIASLEDMSGKREAVPYCNQGTSQAQEQQPDHNMTNAISKGALSHLSNTYHSDHSIPKRYHCRYEGCPKNFAHETHCRRHERQNHGLYRRQQVMKLCDVPSGWPDVVQQPPYITSRDNQSSFDPGSNQLQMSDNDDGGTPVKQDNWDDAS